MQQLYAQHAGAAVFPRHAAMPMPSDSVAASAMDALTDAMLAERRLIEDLTATMRRQRAAVAADDLQGLDDAVFATHRILQTLAEARRRRRGVNRLLGEAEELALHEMDETLGARMTDAARAARDGLQGAARALAGEVDVNRTVLREAMSTGEQFVRALSGAPAEPAQPSTYAAGPMAARAAQVAASGGLLLNRRA